MVTCQDALGRHHGNGKADKRFHRLAIGTDYAEHGERQSYGMAQREAGNEQKRLFARAADKQEAKNKGQMVVTRNNMLNSKPKMTRKNFTKFLNKILIESLVDVDFSYKFRNLTG